MLVAYLDEFGHIGPYVSAEHSNHKTHPVFGYAGFVMPVENVREFGGFFEYIKENLLDWEIKRAGAHPRRWEKKGSTLLTTNNFNSYGKNIVRALDRLTTRLERLNGQVVFYGMEKERGEEVAESSTERSTHMLINSVRGLAKIAEQRDEKIMIFLDAVDEVPRLEAVSNLGGFIYKATEKALKRVVEVPMQLESKHYGNVQFADWICGLVGRTSDFHVGNTAQFSWAPGVYDKLVHAKRCVNDDSYIRGGKEGAMTGILHSRHLAMPAAWDIEREKKTAREAAANKPRAARGRKPGNGKTPKFDQRLGESNPQLAAFYDSLTQK